MQHLTRPRPRGRKNSRLSRLEPKRKHPPQHLLWGVIRARECRASCCRSKITAACFAQKTSMLKRPSLDAQGLHLRCCCHTAARRGCHPAPCHTIQTPDLPRSKHTRITHGCSFLTRLSRLTYRPSQSAHSCLILTTSLTLLPMQSHLQLSAVSASHIRLTLLRLFSCLLG